MKKRSAEEHHRKEIEKLRCESESILQIHQNVLAQHQRQLEALVSKNLECQSISIVYKMWTLALYKCRVCSLFFN